LSSVVAVCQSAALMSRIAIFLPCSVWPLPSAPWQAAHLAFHSRSICGLGAPSASATPGANNARNIQQRIFILPGELLNELRRAAWLEQRQERGEGATGRPEVLALQRRLELGERLAHARVVSLSQELAQIAKVVGRALQLAVIDHGAQICDDAKSSLSVNHGCSQSRQRAGPEAAFDGAIAQGLRSPSIARAGFAPLTGCASTTWRPT
jgi:hypothetical protein